MISGSECDSNDLTSYPLQQKSCHVKMNPFGIPLNRRKSLDAKEMYMFLQNTKGETKKGIQVEKKGWWPGFIL